MIETSSERLQRLCAEYGLPVTVEDRLTLQAKHIAEWRSSILPNDRTPTQRVNAFKRIERMAEKLKEEIAALSFIDRSALDNAYFQLDEPGVLDALVQDLEAGRVSKGQLDFAGFVLPELQRAAVNVSGRINGANNAGAPPLTERQADFIRCIAQSVKPAGIAPAHTGQFFELCEAVFQAGGMTLPSRALRYFMKELRPILRASGHCL